MKSLIVLLSLGLSLSASAYPFSITPVTVEAEKIEWRFIKKPKISVESLTGKKESLAIVASDENAIAFCRTKGFETAVEYESLKLENEVVPQEFERLVLDLLPNGEAAGIGYLRYPRGSVDRLVLDRVKCRLEINK